MFKALSILALLLLVALAESKLQLGSFLQTDQLESLLASSGRLAPFLFVLIMAAAVVVSPIPSVPLDIVAGSIFGPVLGTVYATLGGLIGAMLSFIIARALGRQLFERFPRWAHQFLPGVLKPSPGQDRAGLSATATRVVRRRELRSRSDQDASVNVQRGDATWHDSADLRLRLLWRRRSNNSLPWPSGGVGGRGLVFHTSSLD